MVTRLELRDAVRRRLEDTGVSPVWDDAALNDFLGDAVRRYAVRFPAERTATVALAAGATSAVVSPAVEGSQVLRVTDPNGGATPRQRTQARGDGAGAGGSATGQAWRWWDGSLLLAQPAAAGTWRIDYLGGRALAADDVSAVDVIAGDEEIVTLLAAATALRRRAVEEGKRGGLRDAMAMEAAATGHERLVDLIVAGRRTRARGGWLDAG